MPLLPVAKHFAVGPAIAEVIERGLGEGRVGPAVFLADLVRRADGQSDAASDMLRSREQRVLGGRQRPDYTLLCSNCVSIVSLSSTCCDTVPGRPSRWSGSP